jgi:hypothetical protein
MFNMASLMATFKHAAYQYDSAAFIRVLPDKDIGRA